MLSHLVEGRPFRLAEGGNLRQEALLRHAVTEADLNEALRQAGIERVDETRAIVIEPSGRIASSEADPAGGDQDQAAARRSGPACRRGTAADPTPSDRLTPSAACAAASRATGTRYGLHET